MPILSRMLIGFGIIIALGVVQSALTGASVRSLSRQIEHAAAEPVAQVDSARSAWDAFGEARAHVASVIEGIRYRSSAEELEIFNALAARIDEELVRFTATSLSPETAEMAETTTATIAEWKRNALILLGEKPATAIPAPHVMDRYADEIRVGLEGLVGAALASAQKSRQDINVLAQATQWRTIAMSIGVALLGLLIAVPLALSLTRPLGRLQARMLSMIDGDVETAIADQKRRDEIGRIAQALGYFRERLVERNRLEEEAADAGRLNEQKLRDTEDAFTAAGREQSTIVEELGRAIDAVAQGDLTVRITAEVGAAYEKLKSDFNAAIASLEAIVGTVSTTTEDIRVGVDEISHAAGDLSQRTERQAADLAETTGALDGVLSTVEKTSDGVKRVRQAVTAADTEANASEEIVRKAVEAMGRIDKSSDSISQIIGVIDEIAFQTNLLALNASVEAARAGEAGRGFAVVAQEVRSLAQHSASAASEIKTLISSARPEVQQGVELVSEAGEALSRIGKQVSAINGVVAEMAESAVEQATSIREISQSVGQIDQVTQQNAAMVEESTAATYSLKSKTEELAGKLGQFRITGAKKEQVRRAA